MCKHHQPGGGGTAQESDGEITVEERKKVIARSREGEQGAVCAILTILLPVVSFAKASSRSFLRIAAPTGVSFKSPFFSANFTADSRRHDLRFQKQEVGSWKLEVGFSQLCTRSLFRTKIHESFCELMNKVD